MNGLDSLKFHVHNLYFSRKKTHVNGLQLSIPPAPHVLGYFKVVIKIPINA